MDTSEQLTIGGMWEPTDAQRKACNDLWVRWIIKATFLIYPPCLLQLPDFEVAAAYCDNYKQKNGDTVPTANQGAQHA